MNLSEKREEVARELHLLGVQMMAGRVFTPAEKATFTRLIEKAHKLTKEIAEQKHKYPH